jgi:hypothetical protein
MGMDFKATSEGLANGVFEMSNDRDPQTAPTMNMILE